MIYDIKADTRYCCCRAKRRQFPIRLAFFNDHQQVTGTDVWQNLLIPSEICIQSRANIYVALSRFRSLGSLSEKNKIVNCVYNEIYE
jgi:hypothetical protein